MAPTCSRRLPMVAGPSPSLTVTETASPVAPGVLYGSTSSISPGEAMITQPATTVMTMAAPTAPRYTRTGLVIGSLAVQVGLEHDTCCQRVAVVLAASTA